MEFPEVELLQCYNRGCGQKFNPKENGENACRHHPGEPFFHDAYKGWTCCNKKCTDFTEFLNIKGCTVSSHSNIKPPEPEKPKAPEIDLTDIIVRPPMAKTRTRPPFDTPLITMEAEVAPSLKNTIRNVEQKSKMTESNDIVVGTPCKNNGCKATYPDKDSTCFYHPGYPVFHEGLKFWSCCQKKTSDFTTFLQQTGCTTGEHLWKEEVGDKTKMNCRWDYHQTGTHVVLSIYAKNYDIKESVIKLNPVRLKVSLVFPQEDSSFSLDMELNGIINVDQSKVSMYGTKVEVSMRKAQAGSWPRLDIPRVEVAESSLEKNASEAVVDNIISEVDAVDLSEL